MKRSGFARKPYERVKSTPAPIPLSMRRSASMGPADLVAIPKNPPDRNDAYRELARGQACCMRVPGVCCGNTETTVMAHSNRLQDGKGMGMKANDSSGVFACFTCHSWVDQGNASSDEKLAAFQLAAKRMRPALMAIIADPTKKPRDKAAAQWGLDRIE